MKTGMTPYFLFSLALHTVVFYIILVMSVFKIGFYKGPGLVLVVDIKGAGEVMGLVQKTIGLAGQREGRGQQKNAEKFKGGQKPSSKGMPLKTAKKVVRTRQARVEKKKNIEAKIPQKTQEQPSVEIPGQKKAVFEEKPRASEKPGKKEEIKVPLIAEEKTPPETPDAAEKEQKLPLKPVLEESPEQKEIAFETATPAVSAEKGATGSPDITTDITKQEAALSGLEESSASAQAEGSGEAEKGPYESKEGAGLGGLFGVETESPGETYTSQKGGVPGLTEGSGIGLLDERGGGAGDAGGVGGAGVAQEERQGSASSTFPGVLAMGNEGGGTGGGGEAGGAAGAPGENRAAPSEEDLRLAAEKKKEEENRIIIFRDIKAELFFKGGAGEGVTVELVTRRQASKKGKTDKTGVEEEKVPEGKEAAERVFYVIKAEAGVYTLIVKNAGGKEYEGRFLIKLYEGKTQEVKKEYPLKLAGGEAIRFRFVIPQAVFWEDEGYFSGTIEDSDSMTKYNYDTGIVWREEKDF